jgi:hypothetical protein
MNSRAAEIKKKARIWLEHFHLLQLEAERKARQRSRATRPRPRRPVRVLTEWQIQNKLNKFKRHLVELSLDGINDCGRVFETRAVETLLRAGISPGRHMMNTIKNRLPEGLNENISQIIAQTLSPEWRKASKYEYGESDISYRVEYARKFYGVAA